MVTATGRASGGNRLDNLPIVSANSVVLLVVAPLAALISFTAFATLRSDASEIKRGDRHLFTLDSAWTSLWVGIVSAIIAAVCLVAAIVQG